MGTQEVPIMSQKVVYVRRPVMPMFDPDPDPDPVGIVAVAILAIGTLLAGSTIVSPSLWTNLMIMFKPEIAELEKDRLEAQEKMMNTIVIALGIVCIIVLAYIFWRWNTKKKEKAKAFKQYRNMRNRIARMGR